MKKVLPFVLAALMIPGVALAKGQPPTAGTHANRGKANLARPDSARVSGRSRMTL